MSPRAFTIVPVAPLPPERFGDVLGEDELADLLSIAARGGALMDGRAVWCINSTANGGGVAEMLRSLLAYTRGAGVDTRWLVLHGDDAFFRVTKRLHNRLHGADGDGGPLDDDARADYEAITEAAGRELCELVRPGDVVLLHDPQTAGLAPALRDAQVGVVWRCHVGVDDPGDEVREAWDFLRPYVDATDIRVFSRRRFAWDGLDAATIRVIPPSIDTFSAKNQELAPDAIAGILRVAGLTATGDAAAARFVREDGTTARVDRPATILQEAPIDDGDRVIARCRGGTTSRTPWGSCTASSSTRRRAPTPTCCWSGRRSAPSRTTPRGRPSSSTSPQRGPRCRPPGAPPGAPRDAPRWTTPRRTARWSTRSSSGPTSSCRSRWPRASGSRSRRRCGSHDRWWSAASAACRTKSSTA